MILFILSFLILNQMNNDALNNFRTKQTVNTLLIGGSQVQMSLNDKMLPNSINVSLDAESYQYSYFKLKGIINNNPNIKQVYLGCGYFYYSSFYDEYIYGKHSPDFFSRYFFILPSKEKKNILNKHVYDISSSMRKIFSYGFNNITQKELSFIGFYKNDFVKTSAKEPSINNRIDAQYYEKGKVRDFSSNNQYYLEKIKVFCQSKKIKLILFHPPLHPTYKKKIPHKFINKFNHEMKINKFEVIDCNDIVLSDSCYLPDGCHVSKYGAKLLTLLFKQKINKSE